MINKWKLFNFKSVRDETEIELKPLTILAGSNSSGKSTILQSMLLISQTLQNQIGSRSVILNGPLTRLGQFNDLRSFNSEAGQILVGWECLNQEYGASSIYSCDISFDAVGSSNNYDLSQLQPHLFSCEIKSKSQEGLFSFISSRRSSTANIL